MASLARSAFALSAVLLVSVAVANTTETWLAKRAALIGDVYGAGPGVLPNRSVPDQIMTYPGEPALQGLVWNMTALFPITSTVFYSPITPGKRSKDAFLFHHGHSNCVNCPTSSRDPAYMKSKCRPGCNSSMPSGAELTMPGYSWWDLYNVSNFFHRQGFDVFILSMPLKGVNLGPGSSGDTVNSDHWWFLQWEEQGDHALRYFLEPCVLTVNYAKAQGYNDIYMAGLSGGGWTTTFASAIDKRIKGSFPIAGSVPCAMRNPWGRVPNQTWTGSDQEDFEQNCSPNPNPNPKLKPGRRAFSACNYTCQYLLASLEPERFQVQILHERDSCCFSPQGRHDQMLAYESNIRAELQVDDRTGGGAGASKHGWFTSTANDHTKHEVCAQDKTIISAAVAGDFPPSSSSWEKLPCDILHLAGWQPGSTLTNCAANIEPGNVPPRPPSPTPPAVSHCKHPPCVVAADTCKSSASQLWTVHATEASANRETGNGTFTIVHEADGKCLTALAAHIHAALTLTPCSINEEVSAMQQWTAGPSGQEHLIILASSASRSFPQWSQVEAEALCLNIGIPLFTPFSQLQLYPVQPGAGNEIFQFNNASAGTPGVIVTSVPVGGCLDVIHAQTHNWGSN